MGQKSSIDRLPIEIRQSITNLRDKNFTIDEILLHLEKLNVDVSRSALGRHVKKMDTVAAQIRKSRELAMAIGREFGDDNESRVARTNMEIMHGLVMKLMVGDDDSEGVTLDPKDAMFLATALEKLSKASKTDLDAQIKAAEEKARRQALQKAADTVESAARQKGISAETASDIRKQILGIT